MTLPLLTLLLSQKGTVLRVNELNDCNHLPEEFLKFQFLMETKGEVKIVFVIIIRKLGLTPVICVTEPSEIIIILT